MRKRYVTSSWSFRQATRNGTPCCAAAALIEPVCSTASSSATRHSLNTTFPSFSIQKFEQGRITRRPPHDGATTFGTHCRSHAEVADIVILQEAFGIEAVADVREGSGGVFAGLL